MRPFEFAGRPARALLAGDTGLVIEFGDEIDPEVNALVHELDSAIAETKPQGLQETVPSYRSLLLVFDPLTTHPDALLNELQKLRDTTAQKTPARQYAIPVCYGGSYGEDLQAVARTLGLSADEVVAIHTESWYRVYMIGFAPGFAYLGVLDQRLHLARRVDPRAMTPAGSVMIGGQQTGVAAMAMPSGWHLLGRTPLRAFDMRLEQPFRLSPGDEVQFQSVSEEVYRQIEAKVAEGPEWPQDGEL